MKKLRTFSFDESVLWAGFTLVACSSSPPSEPVTQEPAPSATASAANTAAGDRPAAASAGTPAGSSAAGSGPAAPSSTTASAAGAPASAAGTAMGAAAGADATDADAGADVEAPGAGAAGTMATSAAGTMAAGAAGTMATGAAGSGPNAGTAGAAGGTAEPSYMDCETDDVGPCGTFTTQAGVKLTLGSYGALMEKNVGKGYEAPVATGDADGGATCAAVIASFGEDPKDSAPLQDTAGIDFALYTVYRPAQLPESEKLPVITWGNGTCAKPEGYGALLRYVASHGFFVIAANSRWTQTGSPMTKALDFLEAANADSSSPYYQHLDLSKIGAMGHSQGGMATISAAQDERVKTVIIWNGGSSASKPYLAVSGDQDIGNPTVSGLKQEVEANPPGAWLFYHKTVGIGPVKGHLTLMTQPERVIEPTVAWFKYQLLDDAASRDWFVGNDCTLCKMTDEYEYGQKGLP